jgi:carboxypeptidase D
MARRCVEIQRNSRNLKLTSSGTLSPVPNSYSWTNLTNVVWVEQPVGVGFSQGTPDITNEVELGKEFIGFWRNFIEAFQMHNAKTYITGESYGGYATSAHSTCNPTS